MKLFTKLQNSEKSFTKEVEKTAAEKEEKVWYCRGDPRGRLPGRALGMVAHRGEVAPQLREEFVLFQTQAAQRWASPR